MVRVQNENGARVKPKNQLGRVVLSSLMAEMKQHQHCELFGLLQIAATLDIASLDTRQCQKPPFKLFYVP